jgi:SAM-dependent methyltransferase
MTDWLNVWSNDNFSKFKENNFTNIYGYLEKPPTRILDIGCGLAYESEMFQKKYGSELYLLDGEQDLDGKHQDGFNKETDNFAHYNTIADLKKSYDSRNMKYTFVDSNNIDIPEDVKFDLIVSFASCGFHYPADTYKELIQKHSTDDTVVILDLRANVKTPNDLTVVNVISVHPEKNPKRKTCHVKFK